jgi:hypothetical protein
MYDRPPVGIGEDAKGAEIAGPVGEDPDKRTGRNRGSLRRSLSGLRHPWIARSCARCSPEPLPRPSTEGSTCLTRRCRSG